MVSGDSDSSIARQFQLHSSSVAIHRAKHLPTSPSRLSAADRSTYEAELRTIDLSSKSTRLRKLSARIADLEALQLSRAASAKSRLAQANALKREGSPIPPGLIPAPGAETGLLDDDGRFDGPAFLQYRLALEQAAKEVGQWDISSATSEAKSQATSVTIIQGVATGDHRVLGSIDARVTHVLQQPPDDDKPLIRQLQATLERQSIQSVTSDRASDMVLDGAGDDE